MRRSRRLILLLAVALGGLIAYYNWANSRDHYATLPPIGALVPGFDFPLLSGGRVTPAALRGSPAVLALWASDCFASHQALRGIEQLNAEYAPRGVEVLILADDTDRNRLEAVVETARIRTPVAFTDGKVRYVSNPSAWTRATANTALPTFLVVDASGRIAYRIVGVAADDTTGTKYPFPQLRVRLDSLLSAGPAKNTPTPAPA